MRRSTFCGGGCGTKVTLSRFAQGTCADCRRRMANNLKELTADWSPVAQKQKEVAREK